MNFGGSFPTDFPHFTVLPWGSNHKLLIINVWNGEGNRTPASTNQTLNLYRYFRDSNQTFSNLAAGNLFANIATGQAGEELLARNVVGMTIKPVSANSGDWTDFAPSSNAPLPAVIEVTVTAIGQETAKRLENTANWTDTNSPLIKRAMQTLTTRISMGHKQ